MSKKKNTNKKKKGGHSLSFLSDERLPKILGIVCLFFGLYLFVAFSSYLFTWRADQDKVLRFSWEIIFQGDLMVDNWLGRFGAFISNSFFYWGFGVASFLFIPLMVKLGLDLIRRNPLTGFLKLAKYSILIVSIGSVLLEFLFYNSSFPWGGVFGMQTSLWLTNFLGSIGLILLLLCITIAFFVWNFNPSIENIRLGTDLGSIQLPYLNLFRKEKPIQESTIGGNRTLEPSRESDTLRPLGANPKIEPIGESSQVDLDDDTLEFNLPEAITKPSRKKKEPIMTQFEIEATPNSVVDAQAPIQITKKPIDPELAITTENANHSEDYDPTLDLSSYTPPSIELLEGYEDQKVEIDRAELEANKDQIITTLLNYKIEITKIRATIGPTVTLYEIVPAPGVKISKIKNLEDDIALSLAALGIRIIAPIPGKGTIGIEVPNKKKQIVSLKEVLRTDKFINAKMDLPIALGKTISNEVFVADLAKMPHLLVAGATGQGKSVGINSILMSMLFKKHPSQVKLVLIDPKKVELFPYNSLIKHFLAFLPDSEEPIITETAKVIHTLNSLCIEMDERYDLLKKARARNIKEYNEKFTSRKLNPMNGHKFLPFIVLVIDEFADLIMTAGKEVEIPIARLAQLARAIGIHLIIATQRPSVNIITGVIKANFPARLAFKVTSKIDSRTILDQGGADQLIGRGDMLLSVGGNTVRLQCAFVDTPEVERVLEHIGNQQGYPEPYFLPEFKGEEDLGSGGKSMKASDLDDMFMEAANIVVINQHGSTSNLQRKLQLGYNRAGRIMDQLEALGIVGEARGSKPREVLITSEQELSHYLGQKLKQLK